MLVATPACNDPGPTPVVAGVDPIFAYSDGDLTLHVEAYDTRPSLSVDLDSQSATFDRASVHFSLVPSVADGRPDVALPVANWLRMGTFLVHMPAGVAAGFYDLKVVAPNGRAGIYPAGFRSGGPRPMGPAIDITAPTIRQVVSAGETFNAAFTVDDSGGQLVNVTWTTSKRGSGECTLRRVKLTNNLPDTFDTTSNPDCARIPTPDSSSFTEAVTDFSLFVTATDISGMANTVEVPLYLAQPPVVTSFTKEVAPLEGKQLFTVTGRYFPVGAKVSIGGMRILDTTTELGTGGEWQSDTTIVGLVPPSLRPDVVNVTITTPWGAVGTAKQPFSYVLPPKIRLVQPPVGPAAGGTKVTIAGNDLRAGVMIFFGATLQDAAPLTSPAWFDDAKV
ncbi:MAG TPA: IPT/TIG domain-containing protein, partial [Polyangia bacterium]|nr:IPT/TIG domain-containing protein [Polyangia bacterium]